MRITLIGSAYPLRGGNALFLGHLYEALSRSNTVEVISFSRLYPGFLFPGVRQNDISNVAMKKHPARHIIDCLNPLTWYRAAALAAAQQPDLLIFVWWNPFFGPLTRTILTSFKNKSKAPVVIIAENVISHEGRWIDLFLTKMALKMADYFVVLSAVVEKNIKTLYPGIKTFKSSLPIYDCYNVGETLGMEDAKKRLNIDGKKVILFFGYVRKYKGLMDLLESFALVCAKITYAHLFIVGEYYDDRQTYEEAIDRLKIRNKVTVVAEYVANEDVHYYYRAANVVVLPYREATQSGILSIAFGFSKPVIVTDVGGLAELVENGKTGYVVPSQNVQALADTLIKYFEQDKEKEFIPNVERKSHQNDFNNISRIFDEIHTDADSINRKNT
ncbi:MAG: glycosyltransferase [Bacteroidota bacterium]